MQVLALTAEQRRAAAAEETDGRTGVFTSGIVATRDGHHIALFFTGRQHAGENLADILAHRTAALPPPIQMCDALAANTAGDFDTMLAHCLAHARRRFIDVVDHFPAEVQHVPKERTRPCRRNSRRSASGERWRSGTTDQARPDLRAGGSSHEISAFVLHCRCHRRILTRDDLARHLEVTFAAAESVQPGEPGRGPPLLRRYPAPRRVEPDLPVVPPEHGDRALVSGGDSLSGDFDAREKLTA